MSKRWRRTTFKGSAKATYRGSARTGKIYVRGSRRFGFAGSSPRYTSANAKASRALMLLRKFKKEEELKTHELHSETMQIPIGGNWITETVGPIMNQGTTSATRIGNKITVESLAMRFNIRLSAIEALGCNVRLVLWLDRRPAGALTTIGTLMSTDNNIISGYSQVEAYKGRYQVLIDKTFDFSTTDTKKAGKFFMKKPYKVLYTGTGAGIADLMKNNLIISAMAKGNAAAVDVDYGYKFRFTDA